MAIKKTIEIDVNASAAEKDVDKLIDGFKDLGKSATKSIKNIEDGVESTEKSTKSLSEGFKGVGLAIKAMGIGLIIGALSTLKDVFMGNQKVADTFAAVMGTVANVFSQVTNVIVSVIEKVGQSSNGFEGLKKTIGGLLTLGLTPLKLAFYGIKLTIDEVRLAWEESLFGDGDPKTIKALTKRIDETKTALKDVGNNAVAAGKQVYDNIGKAASEVSSVVEGSVEGISKISVAAAYAQSEANVRLQNTAILAEANQARLVEQYDRQAEKLRQIRDEERNSVEDRIKANNNLKTVLENQQQAMLGQAAAQVAAAKSTLAQNNNIENQAALTRALTNQEGVLAQIEGLRSEQKANDLALNKELIDLTKTKQEVETELAINEKNFAAERVKNEELQLQAKKDALEQNKKLELERLQNVIDSANAGTQAKVDAENEYALKKQELDQQIILAEDAIAENKRNKAVERQQAIIDNDKLTFDARRLALNEQERLLLEDKALSEEQRNAILKQYSDSRLQIDQAEADAKNAIQNAVLDNVAGGLGVLKQLGEKSKAIQKAAIIAENAVGIARIILNTQAANAKSLAASPLTGGQPWVTINTISGALSVASSLLATKKALSELGGGSVSSPSVGGAAGGGSAPAPPQFNVIGNSGVNQIAATLGSQQPVQAYVVANQVTTQQALDRSIVNNASL